MIHSMYRLIDRLSRTRLRSSSLSLTNVDPRLLKEVDFVFFFVVVSTSIELKIMKRAIKEEEENKENEKRSHILCQH